MKAVSGPCEIFKNAYAIAVLTEWDKYNSCDWQCIYRNMSNPAFIFDGRGILNIDELPTIGFTLYYIGNPL